ncbi:matrixin family metalloprotease [uncultured Azohydromonas sp.]|jgi:PEP-CTERM putative exosortase interaction domain|uniref:matrixin family metalloprotease n=1 Tax=uncultured Azohydromonas sp. TaxID=487342 RepID=UPI002622E6FD|nr:matrixin family metalloprotease [uncultured Azohydromonas sp.]
MKKALMSLALVAAMAVPTVASAYDLAPTYPGKWGSPTLGTGATITWSLMPSDVNCYVAGGESSTDCTTVALGSFMPQGYLGEIQRAFDAWSAVADLTFQYVPDDGARANYPTASGDIRIGGHYMNGTGGVLAHGFFPPNNGNSIAGDIHFDTGDSWTIGFAGPGYDIFQVFTHELGHALGLGHSDQIGALMYPYYSESFSGPQADDIAGMQYLYGAPLNDTNDPTPSPVSEPSTLALLGVVVLGMARRRKAKARA